MPHRKLLFILLIVPAIGNFVSAQQAAVQEQLAESRQQIDDIDRQIVDLINKRAAVVEKIGKIKSSAGLPINVPHREQEVLKHVSDLGASGPFPASRLKTIYSTLLAQMRAWEEEQQHSTK
jgi:monofunctional chorismate mutase